MHSFIATQALAIEPWKSSLFQQAVLGFWLRCFSAWRGAFVVLSPLELTQLYSSCHYVIAYVLFIFLILCKAFNYLALYFALYFVDSSNFFIFQQYDINNPFVLIFKIY